jgi:hypothetical protein
MKVLAQVKPDSQFIFDETKIPKMNISDSFRDFDNKLKRQLTVARFGKSDVNGSMPDIILINHFTDWLKSNAMRDAWNDSNLGSSYAARRKMFCKSYGVTRFMINAELSNCKWDGKDDLLAFNARLSAIETRYCEANKTSLDENTQVNHFIERIKIVAVLYEYATTYVQSENNQQRDVTRAELVRQVHLKNQSRQEIKARREKEKLQDSVCEGQGCHEESDDEEDSAAQKNLIEAVSRAAAQVNAISRRDGYNARGSDRSKSSFKCFFCDGPHAQSECELYRKAKNEAVAQMRLNSAVKP